MVNVNVHANTEVAISERHIQRVCFFNFLLKFTVEKDSTELSMRSSDKPHVMFGIEIFSYSP